jgi:hypothetical protein
MPLTNKGDEHSGLHDLKALASSTKQRRSRRLSSEMDAQDSLLQSAASLEAVALPDPSKEQPVSVAAVALTDAPLAAQATTATTATETSAPAFASLDKPKSSSKMLIGLVVVAAAAAAAFFVMNGAGEGDKTETETAAAIAPADTESAPELDPTPVEPAPEVAPLPAADDAEETAGDELAAADLTVSDEATDEEATDEEVVADEVVAEKPEKAAKSSSKKAEKSDKRVKSDKSDKSDKAVAVAKPKKEEKPAKEDKASKKSEKAPVLGEGGADLDDVLSSVTGGVDKPIVSDEKDDKPSKKKLERGDVAKAMKSISSAAKSCYSAEEYTGTVIVKYSVGSDGKIKKAAATGKHKSSKTGKCVVAAVKKAKFPAFSGSTQSFSFPFLLSP